MEGESSREESRFMNGDGIGRRGPPPVGGGRNSNSTGGFRGSRGGSRGGASSSNTGSWPPLLPLLQHPPDWRAQENGPGPRGNFRQGGDMYRNQFRGGQVPHPSMNMNHHPGNMYGGGRNNNYQHSSQQQYNLGGPHYKNNGNYPPRGGSWRQAMEDGRGRGPALLDCHKQYDPEVIRLLEEEGIYQLKRRSLKFKDANFFCRLCDFHCDEPQHCVQHIKSNRHQKLATVREFDSYLQSLPRPSPAMIEAVDSAVRSVSEEHGITDTERQQRVAAVAHLAAMLAKAAPEAQLELTGSTFSGLALKTSDVNVGLFVPDNQSPYKTIMALKAIIEECPESEDLSNDLRSSFPSLSYTASRHGGCRVVVGVGTPSVRAMARLLGAFAALDDRFVVLARALRYWAQLCDVSDQRSGSLPAVAYSVLVVHFLQQVSPPVLPTLRELSPGSYKTEDFPLPKDIKTNFTSENTMSAGDLWLCMLNYYGHQFKFINYNVNVTQTIPSDRNDKTYSKKMSIEDPFNPKRNLTRTISNTAVLEYIIDRLFKVLCRYFSVPQLSFGQLFYTLTVGKTIKKEKRSKNNSLTDSMDKNSAESEVDKSNSSDLDLALERLAAKETSVDSQDDEDTRHITSGDQLTRSFDTISFDEAVRIINFLEKKHFDYKFDKQKFTEGESVPIFCSMCQHEGHIREECEEEKLPELLPLEQLDSKHLQFLSSVLCNLREEMEPTRKEITMREEVVQSLQFYIRKDQKYSDAHLQLFGSSANGFGFTNSDLDVCITFEAERLKEQLDQDFLIHDLVRILRQSREFQDVLAIATAKVPIVKFRCIKTNLEGDLSLYNTLALHNTILLRNYSKIDPRVKILGYGLKYFAKRCDIGDASRGSLSSYAFTLLLIHFLQQCQPAVVPVLQKLYEPDNPPPPVMVEGWNTWFFSDLDNLHKAWPEMGANKMTVGELWVEMFRYYTETFDFDEHVVNIRQKEPMLRLEKLWNNHSIAIEDPFDLNHNLGGALSRKMNTFIRKALINGRHMYGGLIALPQSPDAASKFLFDPAQLTAGAPPNDRGCRKCRKIGHLVKDCPQRPADGGGKRKKQQQQQQQQGMAAGGNTSTQDSPAARGAAPGEGRRVTEQRQAAAGNAPAKKKDAKALLGERGMLRIAEVLPEGTETEDVESSKLFELLKKLLGSEQDQIDVLVLGFRLYTIEWFLTIRWRERLTLLVPDMILENKEPLVLVKLKERQYGRAEQDYMNQFRKHKIYLDEYLVDLSLLELDVGESRETPSRGLFLDGLTQMDQERKQKLQEKHKAKKEFRKHRREEEKKNKLKKNLVQATQTPGVVWPISANSTQHKTRVVNKSAPTPPVVAAPVNKSAPAPAVVAASVSSVKSASVVDENCSLEAAGPVSQAGEKNTRSKKSKKNKKAALKETELSAGGEDVKHTVTSTGSYKPMASVSVRPKEMRAPKNQEFEANAKKHKSNPGRNNLTSPAVDHSRPALFRRDGNGLNQRQTAAAGTAGSSSRQVAPEGTTGARTRKVVSASTAGPSSRHAVPARPFTAADVSQAAAAQKPVYITVGGTPTPAKQALTASPAIPSAAKVPVALREVLEISAD